MKLLLEPMLGALAATARVPVQALQAVQGLVQQLLLEPMLGALAASARMPAQGVVQQLLLGPTLGVLAAIAQVPAQGHLLQRQLERGPAAALRPEQVWMPPVPPEQGFVGPPQQQGLWGLWRAQACSRCGFSAPGSWHDRGVVIDAGAGCSMR